MRKFLIFMVACLATASMASATTIVDGDFNGWSLSTISGPPNAAGVTLENTGGNPGPRLNIMTITFQNNPPAYGLAIDQNVTALEPLAGAFTLGLDVLSGEGDFGQGQSIMLLLQQGSDIYGENLAVTGCCFQTFHPETFTGTFTVASFTHLVGSGASAPDLSGAASTQFGFAAVNSSNDRQLAQYYDNFSLSYGSPAPEPSTFLLAGFAAASLVFLSRRQLARNALIGSIRDARRAGR